MYLLGYIPAHNRVYLVDKDVNVLSYSLSLNVVEYQTAVLRGDMDAAAEILPSIPKEHRNKIATFLEGRGLVESMNNGVYIEPAGPEFAETSIVYFPRTSYQVYIS